MPFPSLPVYFLSRSHSRIQYLLFHERPAVCSDLLVCCFASCEYTNPLGPGRAPVCCLNKRQDPSPGLFLCSSPPVRPNSLVGFLVLESSRTPKTTQARLTCTRKAHTYARVQSLYFTYAVEKESDRTGVTEGFRACPFPWRRRNVCAANFRAPRLGCVDLLQLFVCSAALFSCVNGQNKRKRVRLYKVSLKSERSLMHPLNAPAALRANRSQLIS